MTPDQLLAALRDLHVSVHEHDGWRTRSHGRLEPHVIVVHDSVTGSMSDERAASFCATGRSDLAGPLYECLIGHDGTAHLIANGVTWNAGSGNSARLTQARRGQMPLGQELGRPGGDDTGAANGWAHAVAYITVDDGPYTDAQRDAGARVIAAYCKAEGWGADDGAGSVIGHGEYTRRKVDPELNMGELRTRVHALIGGGGGGEQFYVVVRGDTLFSIARRFDTSVAAIKQLNGLTSDVIRVGQRLRVR